MVPFPWVPNLQVQGHLPTSKTCMRNPEDGTPCDREGSLSGWEMWGNWGSVHKSEVLEDLWAVESSNKAWGEMSYQYGTLAPLFHQGKVSSDGFH